MTWSHSIREILISRIAMLAQMYYSAERESQNSWLTTIENVYSDFVCFTSKAVHLELMSDLSMDCFILPLKSSLQEEIFPKTCYATMQRTSIHLLRKSVTNACFRFFMKNKTMCSSGKIWAPFQKIWSKCLDLLYGSTSDNVYVEFIAFGTYC